MKGPCDLCRKEKDCLASGRVIGPCEYFEVIERCDQKVKADAGKPRPVIDLPREEILAQLAEEAAELAQAALKLRRALDGTNPTPVSEAEAGAALIEELSDVALCCKLLQIRPNYYTMQNKRNRWGKRLEGKIHDGEGGNERV